MKISNTNYINQTYTNQAANQAAKPAASPKAPEEAIARDSINFSSTTRDLQRISAAAENEPADRKKMVQDLKTQVQAGQYTVNAEQVAEKMIGSIVDGLG